MIKCQICGKFFKLLGRHLKCKHGISVSAYQETYPGAEVISIETKNTMRASNVLTGKKVGSLVDRYGEDAAIKIKQKIGKNSGAARIGKKRPQQGETLRKVWDTRRSEWSKSIKDAYTTERRNKLSQTMKEVLSKKMFRYKTSNFEVACAQALRDMGVTYRQQHKISGDFRIFDFYLPEQNLLLECDGEFWHCTEERLKKDIEKTKFAHENGFFVLRISDSLFDRNYTTLEQFLQLALEMPPEDWEKITNQVFASRQSKLL